MPAYRLLPVALLAMAVAGAAAQSSPATCVQYGSAGTVIDASVKPCDTCSQQCLNWGACDLMAWNGVNVTKSELQNGWTCGGAPAPIAPPEAPLLCPAYTGAPGSFLPVPAADEEETGKASWNALAPQLTNVPEGCDVTQYQVIDPSGCSQTTEAGTTYIMAYTVLLTSCLQTTTVYSNVLVPADSNAASTVNKYNTGSFGPSLVCPPTTPGVTGTWQRLSTSDELAQVAAAESWETIVASGDPAVPAGCDASNYFINGPVGCSQAVFGTNYIFSYEVVLPNCVQQATVQVNTLAAPDGNVTVYNSAVSPWEPALICPTIGSGAPGIWINAMGEATANMTTEAAEIAWEQYVASQGGNGFPEGCDPNQYQVKDVTGCSQDAGGKNYILSMTVLLTTCTQTAPLRANFYVDASGNATISNARLGSWGPALYCPALSPLTAGGWSSSVGAVDPARAAFESLLSGGEVVVPMGCDLEFDVSDVQGCDQVAQASDDSKRYILGFTVTLPNCRYQTSVQANFLLTTDGNATVENYSVDNWLLVAPPSCPATQPGVPSSWSPITNVNDAAVVQAASRSWQAIVAAGSAGDLPAGCTAEPFQIVAVESGCSEAVAEGSHFILQYQVLLNSCTMTSTITAETTESATAPVVVVNADVGEWQASLICPVFTPGGWAALPEGQQLADAAAKTWLALLEGNRTQTPPAECDATQYQISNINGCYSTAADGTINYILNYDVLLASCNYQAKVYVNADQAADGSVTVNRGNSGLWLPVSSPLTCPAPSDALGGYQPVNTTDPEVQAAATAAWSELRSQGQGGSSNPSCNANETPAITVEEGCSSRVTGTNYILTVRAELPSCGEVSSGTINFYQSLQGDIAINTYKLTPFETASTAGRRLLAWA